MNNAKKFLEDLQGLIIFLNKKNGITPPLKELMEMRGKNPSVFQMIFDDYKENHETELADFFKGRTHRIKEMYKMTLFEIHQQFEAFGEDGTDEEFEEELKKATEYYEGLISELPTKYQELSSFGTAHHLLDEIMKAAPIVGYQIPMKPIIGTVSTDSINAGAFTLENGEPIIIIQEDFLSFIHLLVKIFVQCLPLGDKGETGSIVFRREEILKTIKEKPEILHRFKDFLKGYLEGSPRKSEQYFLPKDSKYILCTYLMMSAELFMVGHEIGHIIKHHKDSKLKFWCFNEECSTSYEDSRRAEKEFEADKVGLHLSMQAMANNGFQVDFCFIGIECFFIVNDIALKAKQIQENGNEDISGEFRSYPTNTLRRDKIREELKTITPPEELLNATCLPDVIDETMSYLWENSKEIFYQEYERKNNLKK